MLKAILNDESCKVILLDIEGTTTSISFVKDVLFPYVLDHLSEHLDSEWGSEELIEDIKALREQQDEDDAGNGSSDNQKIPLESDDIAKAKLAILQYVSQQMDLDRKTTALKQLQGHIWRRAYEEGKLFGHVYDDVPAFFEFYTNLGKKICIYSSGSVEAQKLLYGHSIKGNLLKYISEHFDTKVGPKTEMESYENIANAVECESNQIVFFTDVPKEANAAKQSGMLAILVERKGNAPLTKDDRQAHPVICSFTIGVVDE